MGLRATSDISAQDSLPEQRLWLSRWAKLSNLLDRVIWMEKADSEAQQRTGIFRPDGCGSES